MGKNCSFKGSFEQSIYECYFCDYVSGRKYDMKRHTLTKHVPFKGFDEKVDKSILSESCDDINHKIDKKMSKTCKNGEIENKKLLCILDDERSQNKKMLKQNYLSTQTENKSEQINCVKKPEENQRQIENKYLINSHTFFCKSCNYKTHKRYNYERHCESSRHKRIRSKENRCTICEKEFKHIIGLKSHYSISHNLKFDGKNIKKEKHGNEMDDFKSIIINIMQENQDIQDKLIKENRDLQEKLIEIAKEPRIINQTNNNQKTFNIIQFLNHECKDAMNLTEFIENLVVTFEDLEKIEEQGYFSGVKDSLIQSIQNMETNKRPIHCTDTKRKHFYIKDENVWNRDNGNMRIENAVTQFNTNQLKTLHSWQKNHPDYLNEQGKQDKVNTLMKEITSLYTDDGKGDRVRKKIMNEISHATFIDK